MAQTIEEDRYALDRFVKAQKDIYEQVTLELQAGQKQGHWMWFIFPQIDGLGQSETARRFAISGQAEARAYLQHPVLGRRLDDCTQLVNAIEGKQAGDIFGFPDELKFHSSMTLFDAVARNPNKFREALEKYFGGIRDPHTLARL